MEKLEINQNKKESFLVVKLQLSEKYIKSLEIISGAFDLTINALIKKMIEKDMDWIKQSLEHLSPSCTELMQCYKLVSLVPSELSKLSLLEEISK